MTDGLGLSALRSGKIHGLGMRRVDLHQIVEGDESCDVRPSLGQGFDELLFADIPQAYPDNFGWGTV